MLEEEEGRVIVIPSLKMRHSFQVLNALDLRSWLSRIPSAIIIIFFLMESDPAHSKLLVPII